MVVPALCPYGRRSLLALPADWAGQAGPRSLDDSRAAEPRRRLPSTYGLCSPHGWTGPRRPLDDGERVQLRWSFAVRAPVHPAYGCWSGYADDTSLYDSALGHDLPRLGDGHGQQRSSRDQQGQRRAGAHRRGGRYPREDPPRMLRGVSPTTRLNATRCRADHHHALPPRPHPGRYGACRRDRGALTWRVRPIAGSDFTGQTGIKPDVLLKNRDIVAVEGFDLTVIHLRATRRLRRSSRTRLLRPIHIFAGRLVVPWGAWTGNFPARLHVAHGRPECRIFDVYADETLVPPGHGKPTTLGVERPRLGEWRARGW